jgi:hypothetical protein
MTRYEANAKISSHMIQLLAALGIAFVICYAPTKDEADDAKIRAQVEQQAKAAAQPDTWAGLDRDGKQLVSYGQIKHGE